MSIKTCKGCGRITNTALSNWTDEPDWNPKECYAAWDEKKRLWVEGCALKNLNKNSKLDSLKYNFAKKYIKGK